MRILKYLFALAVGAAAATNAQAQTNLPVYTDSLLNGFQDWGWTTHNYANTSPVHSGANSVSVTIDSAWGGLQIYHPDLKETS